MGTDRKSHRKSRDTRISKVNRSLAVGAVAGATAIGFGALSSVAAPTANADWWEILTNNGNDNGHNRAASDNNTLFGAINGNGNPTQLEGAGGSSWNSRFTGRRLRLVNQTFTGLRAAMLITSLSRCRALAARGS